MTKSFLLGAIASLTIAASAGAQTVVQNQTIATNAPTTSTVFFNKFNGQLGTLNSVTLDFVTSMVASGTFRNPANAPASRTFALSTGATALMSGNGFFIFETLGASGTTLTVPRQTTINIGPFTGSNSGSQTLTSGFNPFIGTGTTGLTFTSLSLFAALPANGQLNIIPQIGGTATLTYNYTAAVVAAVPEVSTWGMMIAGFGVMGVALRRRRTVNAKLQAA